MSNPGGHRGGRGGSRGRGRGGFPPTNVSHQAPVAAQAPSATASVPLPPPAPANAPPPLAPAHATSLQAPAPPPQTPQDTDSFTPWVQPSESIGGQDYFQSITFCEPHQRFSFEELRLNDYKKGQGVLRSKSKVGSQVFGSKNLVSASVPPIWDSNRLCRKVFAFSTLELGFESVILRVGKDEAPKDFLVHRALITQRSPFVREALKGEWKEAASGVVTLPEDEPQVVALYQKWLYTGCLFSERPGFYPHEDAKQYPDLVKCYILGDKLLDSRFKDTVIDAIFALLIATRLFDATLTQLVYDSTPPKSPLRKLWQDIYITCGSVFWLKDEYRPHYDLVLCVARRQLNSSSWPGNSQALSNTCSYHEHEGGKCYRAI